MNIIYCTASSLSSKEKGLEYSFLVRYESRSVKRGFEASAKSIGLGQPAQSTQADLGRNFSLSDNFLYVQESFYFIIRSVVKTVPVTNP